MNKTFKHSGDMGDIIYSLPIIKRLGGGVLYLDIKGGEDEPICKAQCLEGHTKFNLKSFEFIKTLIEAQSYIKEVAIYNKQPIDCNLNNFRFKFDLKKPLLQSYTEAFEVNYDINEPWIEINNPKIMERKTIVCRSPRYQSAHVWFESNKLNFQNKAAFVGLEKEHEYFEWVFGIKIPFYKTQNALELAQIIAGSKAFVSNQTFALALAIGLGNTPIVQEVDKIVPNCVYKNKRNMNYI
jgi:hypothetical protein